MQVIETFDYSHIMLEPTTSPINNHKIKCVKCLKKVEPSGSSKIIAIMFGLMVDNVFFPEKKNHRYHLHCLLNKSTKHKNK